jgi:hypothetical protein
MAVVIPVEEQFRDCLRNPPVIVFLLQSKTISEKVCGCLSDLLSL